MPPSTAVTVRKESVAFPPRCVVCHGDDPGETIGLRGNPVGLHGMVSWLFGRTGKLAVPAHRTCGASLSRAVFLRNFAVLTAVTAVLIVAIAADLAIWQIIGLALAASVLPIVWQVMRPLPFEFTSHGDHYKLLFSDEARAREIAAMNDGEIEGREN